MASLRKRGDKWEAFVSKKGIRKSATFYTKAEAQAWALRTELEIEDRKRSGFADKTFGELMQEYSGKVSPGKKGAAKERIRLAMHQRDPIAKLKLKDLDAIAIADWRDRRLKVTKPGSVLRDWTLLNNAVNVAVKEWKWLPHNPMTDVKRPKEPAPRSRIVTDDELERMSIALGDDVGLVMGRVGLAMWFALETAMRCGEIAALRRSDIDTDRRVCKVTGTAPGGGKNRAARRDVPLSSKAVEILNRLGDDVFGLNSSQIDIQFRKAKVRAVCEGFTFHDLRHNAITNLSKKLDVLELARAVGHGNLKELLVYYAPDAESVAKKLD